MLSKLIVNPRTRTIDNLPDGWITLFLAKTSSVGGFLYVAVIGPKEACLSTREQPFRELAGAAKVVQFTAENFRVHDVVRGTKYSFGGGLAQTEEQLAQAIMWTTPDECGRNEAFGERITLDNVIVTS